MHAFDVLVVDVDAVGVCLLPFLVSVAGLSGVGVCLAHVAFVVCRGVV